MTNRINTDRQVAASSTDGSDLLYADREQRLDIRLGVDSAPSSAEHHLLVGFQFGAADPKHEHPAIVNLDLAPLDRDSLFEGWWYKGDVDYRQSGSVRTAECDEYSVAVLQKDESTTMSFEEFTRDAYRELLLAVRSTKNTELVKIWSYFDNINRGDSDREKYRQFSVGRAQAFAELGISDKESPTGTAIGTPQKSAFTLIALASRQNFRPVENPRQLSAFHYPRQYGPKSPKFSRGGCVAATNHTLYLLSGTAAVVGHESAHPFETNAQTSETLTNLESLCSEISKLGPNSTSLVLDDETVMRVYLRNPDDLEAVAKQLRSLFGNQQCNIAFLHGSICRRELMVEIDGAKVS